jgi:hypothetical protein
MKRKWYLCGRQSWHQHVSSMRRAGKHAQKKAKAFSLGLAYEKQLKGS